MRETVLIDKGTEAVKKGGRFSYLFEFLAIVVLTALAAYGAS